MSETNKTNFNEKPSTLDQESNLGEAMPAQGEGMPTLENLTDHAEMPCSECNVEETSHPENPHDPADAMPPEQSAYLDGLMKELSGLSDVEAKLQKIISFMEEALAQTGRPHFKSFWQARSLCLQLFKEESISSTARAALWSKYTELSQTARRLKELFDEQSAFAVEQIEIAVNALETEINQVEQQRDLIPPHEMNVSCKTLETHSALYCSVQGELDLLNTKAARINSLRKELINTGMPSRKKNKFFHRLSLLGDKVFPRRKDLIHQLSQQFISDVNTFTNTYFSREDVKTPLFFLREEIKTLQAIAKQLTLNTQAFTHTRKVLSECWDKIKVLDKERKKERVQQKSLFKENEEAVVAKIEECQRAITEGPLSPAEGLKKLEEVVHFMRGVQLGRGELNMLREQLDKLRQPLLDQIKTADQRRHDQEAERQQLRERSIVELRSAIENLLNTARDLSMDQLTTERETILERIQSAQMARTEKLEFERLLKPLRDILLEKRASALKNLSENDRQSLEQLKELLKDRKELRNDVKEQLEALRRSVGSSGLGFEKALEYNSQISEQKERLEKINQGIQEVDEQIEELEKKLY